MIAANGSLQRVPRHSDSKIPSRSPAASMAARASSIGSGATSLVDTGTGAATTGGVITGRAGASDTTVAGAAA